jgi:hypothetical protein
MIFGYVCVSKNEQNQDLQFDALRKAGCEDQQRSRQYMDSSLAAVNRYNARFSALKVLRPKQRVSRQNVQLQLAGITFERQQKIAEQIY